MSRASEQSNLYSTCRLMDVYGEWLRAPIVCDVPTDSFVIRLHCNRTLLWYTSRHMTFRHSSWNLHGAKQINIVFIHTHIRIHLIPFNFISCIHKVIKYKMEYEYKVSLDLVYNCSSSCWIWSLLLLQLLLLLLFFYTAVSTLLC